jgi:hypothetical protein
VTSSFSRLSISRLKFRRAIFIRNQRGETMKSKSAVPLLLLLVVGAIFAYSGCAAIGNSIGARVDSHSQIMIPFLAGVLRASNGGKR